MQAPAAIRLLLRVSLTAQGKEATFQFLEAVLKEVLDLFPFPVIHIGGDEVCPAAKSAIVDYSELGPSESFARG